MISRVFFSKNNFNTVSYVFLSVIYLKKNLMIKRIDELTYVLYHTEIFKNHFSSKEIFSDLSVLSFHDEKKKHQKERCKIGCVINPALTNSFRNFTKRLRIIRNCHSSPQLLHFHHPRLMFLVRGSCWNPAAPTHRPKIAFRCWCQAWERGMLADPETKRLERL